MMVGMVGHRAPDALSPAARRPRGYVGVVGPGTDATTSLLSLARKVGALLADEGFVVVTGGLVGVMEAASRGAVQAGGLTMGLLPGDTRAEANPYVTIVVPTGLGEMRNALLVRVCDAVISVGGSWGTLSEVSLACRTGVPVVALAGWHLPADGGPVRASTPQEAVERTVALLPVRGGT
jgi:uncharacterized protein (TIGR00725 family)